MYRKDLKEEFYTKKAKKEGYPARSVYKLQQINDKFKIFRKRDKVLDLGAAPGSWLLYISQMIGLKGKVVGVDIEDIKISTRDNLAFLKKDITNLQEQDFKEIGSDFNVVAADLASKTSGIAFINIGRSLELNQAAFKIVQSVLINGGIFVLKIFEGEDVDEFIKEISKSFQETKRFRPQATLKRSREMYVICKGFIKQ